MRTLSVSVLFLLLALVVSQDPGVGTEDDDNANDSPPTGVNIGHVDNFIDENKIMDDSPPTGVDIGHVDDFVDADKKDHRPLTQTNPEEGPDMFEGDIDLDEETRNAIFGNIRAREALSLGEQYRWPGNTMPFVFDAQLSGQGISAVQQAMDHIISKTNGCIKFVARSNQGSYVRFFPGEGCYSRIGRNPNNVAQDISIGPGCETLGIAAHEILHALGFFHEQSRLDRDDFVTVRFENIRAGRENNFRKYSAGQADTLGAPYDYGSLMHYGTNYFTKNGEDTIVPKDADATIGQRAGLSDIDAWQLSKLYECPGVDPNPPPPPTSRPILGNECVNHKTLSEANRIESHNANGQFNCDNNLAADWYRFIGAAGSHLPEKAPERNHCGTQAPGWLNGKHPSVENKIVGAEVCFHWISSECQWKERVFIRNCGGFFVYYLSPVPGCNMRYCGSNSPLAPLPSTPSPTNPPPTSQSPQQSECIAYETLNEPDRSINYKGSVKCDSGLKKGWYRFEGSAGDRMPESAPEKQYCGTHAPGWLDGKHPAQQEGKVERKVCFHWSDNNCLWSQQIQVRNCGGFFVYELSKPPVCSLRFCVAKALPATQPPPTTSLPATQPPPTTSPPITKPPPTALPTSTGPPSTQLPLGQGFVVLCLPAEMQVKVPKDVAADSSLRLNDPECGIADVSDTHVVLKTPLDGCGTVRRSLHGRQIYANNVMVAPHKNENEKRENPMSFPFRCSYTPMQLPPE